MGPDTQFGLIKQYIQSLEPVMRLAMTVKLYFAYFLTLDELHKMYSEFESDFRLPEADTLYRATFDWFNQFHDIKISNFDELMDKPRPFIWDYDVLKAEFADFLAKSTTLFITNNFIDYSSMRQLEDKPLYEIDWFEERGLIRLDGMLLSRSTQMVLIGDQPTEKFVLALPDMSQEEFTRTFPMIPAMGGGCAFKGVYGPAHLCINYADIVGIDDVDTAMLCTGVIVENPETKKVEMKDLESRVDYFKVTRILRNKLEVPFVE